jgi:hypothetical protein
MEIGRFRKPERRAQFSPGIEAPHRPLARKKPRGRPELPVSIERTKSLTGTLTRLSHGLDAMKIDFQAFAV